MIKHSFRKYSFILFVILFYFQSQNILEADWEIVGKNTDNSWDVENVPTYQTTPTCGVTWLCGGAVVKGASAGDPPICGADCHTQYICTDHGWWPDGSSCNRDTPSTSTLTCTGGVLCGGATVTGHLNDPPVIGADCHTLYICTAQGWQPDGSR